MLLIYILIIGFLLLIGYQIYLESTTNNLIEGLENETSTDPQFQAYNVDNPNNALILAQQNAGNFEYLKGRILDIQGMNKQVQDLSGNVVTLQEQVNGLVTAQQQYATQMTGGVAPEISGAIPQEDDEPTTDTSNLVTQ